MQIKRLVGKVTEQMPQDDEEVNGRFAYEIDKMLVDNVEHYGSRVGILLSILCRNAIAQHEIEGINRALVHKYFRQMERSVVQILGTVPTHEPPLMN